MVESSEGFWLKLGFDGAPEDDDPFINTSVPSPCSLPVISLLGVVKTGGCPEFVYNGEFGSVLPVAGANVLVFALSRKGPLLMANAATIRATIKPISIPIPMLIAEPELRRGWLVLLVMKFPK